MQQQDKATGTREARDLIGCRVRLRLFTCSTQQPAMLTPKASGKISQELTTQAS